MSLGSVWTAIFLYSGVSVVTDTTSSSVVAMSLGRYRRGEVGSYSELVIAFDEVKYKTKSRSGVVGEVLESKGRSAYLS
jgi:hypothetical protein